MHFYLTFKYHLREWTSRNAFISLALTCNLSFQVTHDRDGIWQMRSESKNSREIGTRIICTFPCKRRNCWDSWFFQMLLSVFCSKDDSKFAGTRWPRLKCHWISLLPRIVGIPDIRLRKWKMGLNWGLKFKCIPNLFQLYNIFDKRGVLLQRAIMEIKWPGLETLLGSKSFLNGFHSCW